MKRTLKTTWANMSYREVQRELASMRSSNKYANKQAAGNFDKTDK